jgi:hypothetical protein
VLRGQKSIRNDILPGVGKRNETERNETEKTVNFQKRNETERKKITRSRNETKRNGKQQETKQNITILFRNEKNETEKKKITFPTKKSTLCLQYLCGYFHMQIFFVFVLFCFVSPSI